MLPSQNERNHDRLGRTAIRVVLGLVLLTFVAFTSVSVLTRASGSREASRLSGASAGPRKNSRLRAEAAVAKATAFVANPLMPMVAITVDRTDDAAAASACTAAPTDCSLRGAVSFANSNANTAIIVPAGTYNLTIPGGAVEGFNGDNSMSDLDVLASGTTISGAGAGVTIIRQSQPNDRVLEINPFLDAAFIFDISDVTITNGHETTAVGGGGIIGGSQNNVTTITNCIFSSNSATGAGTFGGGGLLITGGNLTISGTTFSGNSTSASGGGLSYSAGDPLGRSPSAGVLTVTGSTFSSNTAASTAAGGGAADLFDFNLSTGTYNFSSSAFSGNSATTGSGGAIIVESGGPLTISTSSFTGNTAAGFGGAILAGGSAASVTFSRLVGNSVPIPANGLTIFSTGSTVDANDDWWGVNTGPGLNDARSSSGAIPITTWLQLRHLASPNPICTGGTSTLTADIKQRNVGAALTTELNGLPAFPDPAATIFSNPVLGTISGASTQFVNGSATATFTAGAIPGNGSADATADNETETASILIQNTTATAPADQSVCQGVSATFSTTAGGVGPFHYAWTVDGSAFGGDTASITVPTGSLSPGAHPVTVTVSGACGSSTQSATLTVQEATTATTPADQTVCQGVTANFSTTAGGTGPFHYAWTVDGSAFGGDTSSISVPTGSLTTGPHTVSVTVTGTCGSVTKNATLTVQAGTTATTPADQTVCQGSTATFSTTAGGPGPFSYAWTVDGSAFGGNTSSISVPTAALSVGTHAIAVTVSGACGSVTRNATLTVQATTSATTPAAQTVCKGATATFSTTASGTGPFTYQWKLDGSNIAGATNSTVNINTSTLSGGSHTVDVVVNGACGSVIRSTTLTVNTAPVVTTNPMSQSASSGTVTFTAAASGSPTPTVQWQVSTNGGASFSNIPGATSTSLTVTASPANNGNQYRAVFTNSCGTATTTAATLTSCSAPVITLSHSTLSMWPPNHKYNTFSVTDFVASATSNCFGNILSSVVIAGVTSDETENGNGDGNTANDIVIAANCKSVQLRSERDGGGDGRVYTITFRVTDAAGNVSTATATVTVPHSQNGSPAINSGVHYSVNGTCP
jgi:hypothetical protein